MGDGGVAGVNEKDWEDGMDLGFKGSNMLQTGAHLVNCSRLLYRLNPSLQLI